MVLVSQAPVSRLRFVRFDAPRARSGHLCCRDRDNICFFISTRDPHSTYLAFPPPVAAPLLQSYRTSLAVLLQALEAASPLLRHSGRISYFRWGAALQWRQFRRAAATQRRSGIIGDDFQNAFALSLAPTEEVRGDDFYVGESATEKSISAFSMFFPLANFPLFKVRVRGRECSECLGTHGIRIAVHYA